MKSIESKGWFSIDRKIFSNELWLSEPFTKAQAWIDIVGNANYSDGGYFIRGNRIEVKRGQLGWSELTMSARWHWSRQKVRTFLAYLENMEQIRQQKMSRLTTIITIINYDKYQGVQQTEQQGVQQKDNRLDNRPDTYNKDNKDNKDNKRESTHATNFYKHAKILPEETLFLEEEDRAEIESESKLESSYHTVGALEKDKGIVVARAKILYKDKDCDKAFEDFVEYCKYKGPKYKNYLLAYLKWVREDRYNQYKLSVTEEHEDYRAILARNGIK